MTDEELQSLRERAETTLGSEQDLLFGPARHQDDSWMHYGIGQPYEENYE